MGDPGVVQFWQAFCARTGATGAMPGTTRFGDGAGQQDALCALVLSGRKRATASLALWYGYERERAPEPGTLQIVLDGSGAPRGVIETVSVFEAAFREVDAAFAADEGEGDGSLAYWRAEHRRFFSGELAREGLAFTEDVRVLCERVRLVWVPK